MPFFITDPPARVRFRRSGFCGTITTTPTTTKQNKTMKKILRIGTVPQGTRRADLFCAAEIQDGKLSITGVIGPKSNGDAVGGCGQIDMEFAHRKPADDDRRYSSPIQPKEITFAQGWTSDLWFDFLDIWKKWHLNDMRPNCEHQVGDEWNTSREITLYHFRLAPYVVDSVRDAKNRAKACIKSGETFKPTETETKYANMPDTITLDRPDAPAGYVPNGPQYTGDHYNKPSETKTAGWVNPSEHPLGLLSKPCPVCGYKYGTQWRKAELPDSVRQFIAALPDADKQPAWV